MPIIKSAKKRVRVTKKASIKNAKVKKNLKASIKAFQAAISGKKDSTTAQSEVYSAIDTAAKKGIMSKNKAARKKSQVNAQAKAAGTTKVGAKAAPKKATATKKAAPAKKSPAKAATKAPAKKTAAKKTAAKPTAKKAPVKKK